VITARHCAQVSKGATEMSCGREAYNGSVTQHIASHGIAMFAYYELLNYCDKRQILEF
jgi:hypothetical protein